MQWQWRWLEEHVSPDKLDTAIDYLTYHVTGLAFYITLIVLIVAVISLRIPLIEGARARQAEAEARRVTAEEKRLDRAMDLLRIAAGYDPKKGAEASTALQITECHLLEGYPEFHAAYVFSA